MSNTRRPSTHLNDITSENAPLKEEKKYENESPPLVVHGVYHTGVSPERQQRVNICTLMHSMFTQSRKLGDTPSSAASRTAKVTAGIVAKRCPALSVNLPRAIFKLPHQQSIRFYNRNDGSVNEELLEMLKKRCTLNENNTLILTEKVLYAFLKERREAEAPSNICSRLFGQAASNGEWEAFWDMYCPVQNGVGNRSVSWEDFEEFFKAPLKAGAKAEHRIEQERQNATTPSLRAK